jgi:hypothetical protein
MVPRPAALAARLRGPENVSILTAIVVAIPATLLVETRADGEGLGLLLLIAVGVVVPTMYRQQWPHHESVGGAVAWTVAASALVGAVLLGLAALLRTYVGLGGFASAALAFLVVGLGGPVVLYSLTGEPSA